MANDDVISSQFEGEKLLDYEWPLKSGDRWVIQEQFVQFLDISGFKRKYPKIYRRRLETEEVKHLYELKYLSEQQYSMGVMAISVPDAQDVLRKDFPARHDEFLRQKMKMQRLSMKLNIPADEMPAQLKKAAKSVCFFLFIQTFKWFNAVYKIQDKIHFGSNTLFVIIFIAVVVSFNCIVVHIVMIVVSEIFHVSKFLYMI